MSELKEKLRGKSGIRFFGDVHGCYSQFASLVEDAYAKKLHLHSLGDLINKGPDSASAMALACDLADAGWFDLTPGNHCEKFTRWVLREGVKLKEGGLGSTVLQLARRPDGQKIADRYFALVRGSRLWSRYGKLYAVHASMLPGMLGKDGPTLAEASRTSHEFKAALDGETNIDWQPGREGLAKRTFNWAEKIPADAIVLVGHTVVSFNGVRERRSAQGGRVIHLDTGLCRGGALSYVDVPAEMLLGDRPLHLRSFAPAGDLVEARLLKRAIRAA